jgi:hypothetical protein
MDLGDTKEEMEDGRGNQKDHRQIYQGQSDPGVFRSSLARNRSNIEFEDFDEDEASRISCA